jgi:hypothetical protein
MQANEQRIASELAATADALRQVRSQLCQLVAQAHPAVTGRPETSVVVVGGLDVLSALKSLAARMGEGQR